MKKSVLVTRICVLILMICITYGLTTIGGSEMVYFKENSLMICANDVDKTKLINKIASVCGRPLIIKSKIVGKVSWHGQYRDCSHAWNSLSSVGLRAWVQDRSWIVDDLPQITDVFVYEVKHYPADKVVKWLNEKASAAKQCMLLSFANAVVCPKSNQTEHWLSIIDRPVRQVSVQAWIWLADKNTMNKKQLWPSGYDTLGQPRALSSAAVKTLIHNINVWDQQGYVRLLASPQMIVMNQTKATIAAGDEVPYWHEKQKDMIVDFKKAMLSLSVKPAVITNEKGVYELELSYDKPSSSKGGYRHIIRHHLKTQVELKHEQAIVVGGLEQTYSDGEHRCPFFLGHLPFINQLLCDNSTKIHKKSLYMLLTIKYV